MEEKLRQIEKEKLLEIQERVSEFEKQANEAIIKHKDFMADIALSETTERYRVSGIFIELDTKIKQKRDEISSLVRERDSLVKTLEEYEKTAVLTKKRILQKAKYERESQLAELNATYQELMDETTAAISLIKAKLAEWSNAERIAYEERMGREETAKLNRLGLSELSMEELVELFSACKKLRLANPVPLYKAIYEIYFRGPVKELGVKLGVVGVCGIYKITNVVSGKVYVGQSVDIAERWKQHIKRGTKCEVGTLAGAGLYEAMFVDGV